MEMCYDGALVMPNNYAVVDAEEMTYVEGGMTGVRYLSAQELVGVSDTIVNTAVGSVLASLLLGGLAGSFGGPIGAALGAAIAGVATAFFFYSWWDTFRGIHNEASNIVLNEGANVRLKLTTTVSSIGICTGASITRC